MPKAYRPLFQENSTAREYSVLSRWRRKLRCHIHSLSVITFSDLLSIVMCLVQGLVGFFFLNERAWQWQKPWTYPLETNIPLLPHCAPFHFVSEVFHIKYLLSHFQLYFFFAKMKEIRYLIKTCRRNAFNKLKAFTRLHLHQQIIQYNRNASANRSYWCWGPYFFTIHSPPDFTSD